MTHTEMIARLSLDVIREMPYNDLACLTGNFSEKDIRTILAKSDDIENQRSIIAFIKDKYTQWERAKDPFNYSLREINKHMGGGKSSPDYPQYMEDIDLSLKYNLPIEEKKKFSMPYTSPVSLRELVAGTKATETPNITEYKAHIKELETGKKQFLEIINEKDTEIESLKRQLDECQSKLKTSGMQNDRNDEWVVELFSHFCYEDTEVARNIIEEMRYKTDPEIADILYERMKQNKISQKTNNIDLWRVLHAAKLIESNSYQNLDTALRRRRKKGQ